MWFISDQRSKNLNDFSVRKQAIAKDQHRVRFDLNGKPNNLY